MTRPSDFCPSILAEWWFIATCFAPPRAIWTSALIDVEGSSHSSSDEREVCIRLADTRLQAGAERVQRAKSLNTRLLRHNRNRDPVNINHKFKRTGVRYDTKHEKPRIRGAKTVTMGFDPAAALGECSRKSTPDRCAAFARASDLWFGRRGSGGRFGL